MSQIAKFPVTAALAMLACWPALGQSDRAEHLGAADQIEAAPDYRVPDATLTLSDDKQVIYLQGFLAEGTYLRFARLARANPQVRTVHLASPGGVTHEGYMIGNFVRWRKMDTYVEHECNSACPMIFAGGVNRVLGPDARLGFHQAYMMDGAGNVTSETRFQTEGESEERIKQHRSALFAPDGEGTMIKAMRRIGVADEFTARMMEAPPESLLFPEQEELQAAGLVTAVAATSRFPLPAGSVSRAEVLEKLRDQPLWAALQGHDETRFRDAVDHLWRQINMGQPYESVLLNLRQEVVAELMPLVVRAPDAQFLAFGEFLRAQGRFERLRGYRGCRIMDNPAQFEPGDEQRAIWRMEGEAIAQVLALGPGDFMPMMTEEEAGKQIDKTIKNLVKTPGWVFIDAKTDSDVCEANMRFYEAALQLKDKDKLRAMRGYLTINTLEYLGLLAKPSGQ